MVWEELKRKTILLLLLAAALLFGFGIKEEGAENGWYDGVIILISIMFLIVFNCFHKYCEERMARKKTTEPRVGEVHVIRGGNTKDISESKLVRGDIVLLKKGCHVPADGLFVAGRNLELDYGSESHLIDDHNPFLSIGDRVIDGEARMVVTSEDVNIGWREKMTDSDPMKFNVEVQLDKLNTIIHYTGINIFILILIVSFWNYVVGNLHEDSGQRPESISKPTGMRTFANSFQKILRESERSRVVIKLLSLLLIGITEVVPFVISYVFQNYNRKPLSAKATKHDSLVVPDMALLTRVCTGAHGDFSGNEVEVDKLFIGNQVISGCTTLSSDVVEALCDGIGILTNQKEVLQWAKEKLGFKSEGMRQRWEVLKQREEPYGALMRGVEEREKMMLHLNGPLKLIVSKCSHYYDSKGHQAPLDEEVKKLFDEADEKTIAFACKRTDTQTLDADDLVLVALLCLKEKSSNEVTQERVKELRKRGIETVIISSKKVPVLHHDIALPCGVVTNDSESLVLSGEDFRKLTSKERLEKVDEIRVIGEALPFDKFLLVETLKKKGHVVAFLGQRTDEAPALKAADIGIAMGTWSTEKARENSRIFMSDWCFIDLIDSGKCIYGNIQRFLQLYLIMSLSSTMINLLGAAALGDAPLTTFQLAWVNLAVSFLGGYALLTKPPSDEPVSCGKSLITAAMISNILIQVFYQTTCLVVLQGITWGDVGASQKQKTFMVTNAFILCQFFNLFNARELENNNFFRGLHRHKEFWVAGTILIVLQALMAMVQHTLGYTQRLDWKLCVGCFLIGIVSWLVDWIGKCSLIINMCHENSRHIMFVVSFCFLAYVFFF